MPLMGFSLHISIAGTYTAIMPWLNNMIAYTLFTNFERNDVSMCKVCANREHKKKGPNADARRGYASAGQ